jgi:hypothetical protein
MPFQDVYDVMGRSTTWLKRFSVMPAVYRMTMDVNKVLHLSHPRPFMYIRPELRDFFMRDPAKWGGMALTRQEMWLDLLKSRHGTTAERDTDQNLNTLLYRSLVRHRLGPNGTVKHHGRALCKWLTNGGYKELRAFYAARNNGHS